MAKGITILPLFFLVGVFCIALPIVIGLYVYRDAKQRGMNPALWTLLAVLAPGFIGFIIYLVVRSENSGLHCPTCGKNVRYNFSVCPYCGSSLKAKCSRCGFVLEPGWETCPNCAETIPPEQRITAMPIRQNDKSLRRILAVAIVIPLALCVLLIFGVLTLRTIPVSVVDVLYTQEISKFEVTSPEVKEWIKDCDSEGTGAYILKYTDPDSHQTEDLLYCNYKTEFSSVYAFKGFFSKPTMKITLIPTEDVDEPRDYLLFHITAEINKDYKIDIHVSDYETLDYNLTDAADIGLTDGIMGFDEETVSLDVTIADNVKSVYGITWTLWSGDEPITTEGEIYANGDYLEETSSFSTRYLEEENITSFSFELLNKNGKTVFESGKYKLSSDSDYECFGFTVGYNEKGKLDIISRYFE